MGAAQFFVGNLVSLLAAPRAVLVYIGMLRGAPPVWDKTRHAFPDLAGHPVVGIDGLGRVAVTR